MLREIDARYEIFKDILKQAENNLSTESSETDHRFQLIDRILREVLGWDYSEINTEVHSESGFTDYVGKIHNIFRLIIEAKKTADFEHLPFGYSGRSFKLNGPVFSGKSIQAAAAQAIRYCGSLNVELAVLTDGFQWIIFRGSRLGDGIESLAGHAFCFRFSSEHTEGFRQFYELLNVDSVDHIRFRGVFQEVEGIAVRPLAKAQYIRYPAGINPMPASDLERDLVRISNKIFSRLDDADDEMLAKCFVASRESHNADIKLTRLTKEMASIVREIDPAGADNLQEILKRAQSSGRNEFVVIVGTKGAGKSTFITRFFKHILDKDIRENCILIKLDVSKNGGNESGLAAWLEEHTIRATEKAIFGNSALEYDTLQGLFFDVYTRWMKGEMKPLYESDKTQFKIDFGRHVAHLRENQKHDYLIRLISHIATHRKQVPILVFDNADHFSITFQEKVFQFARSIYEQVYCLIILPITDKTSWNLPTQNALQSFENEILFLPAPNPQHVLKARINYIEEQHKVASEQGRDYLYGKGIYLDLENLDAFCATLQKILIDTGSTGRWITRLSNSDIRRALHLTRDIIASPHLKIGDLMKAYIVGSAALFGEIRVKRAIVRGSYFDYHSETNEFVRNVFNPEIENVTSPLHAVRILLFLRDVAVQARNTGSTFVKINQCVQFMTGMSYDPPSTLKILQWLLSGGLIWSFDPTQLDIHDVDRIEISPSGIHHYYMSVKDEVYLESMAVISPIFDEPSFQKLSDSYAYAMNDHVHRQASFAQFRSIFAEYVMSEDRLYCKLPDHPAYASQHNLRL